MDVMNSKLPQELEKKIEKQAGEYAYENSSFRDCSLCNNKEHGLEQGYVKGGTDLALEVKAMGDRLLGALKTARQRFDSATYEGNFDNYFSEVASEIAKWEADWKVK